MTAKIADVRTPCLLLDERRMDREIARVSDHALRLGVTLRPHFKTPKSLAILRRMTARAGDGRVTVSTLREAEFLARHGFTDLLLTTPMSPRRLDVVADLARQGANLTVILSSLASVEALIAAAHSARVGASALIELDVDGFRGGLALDSDDFGRALDLLRRAPEIALRGVMVYPGAGSRLRDNPARAALGAQHRDSAVRGARILRQAGFSDEVRSFGSTAILLAMDEIDGVTEHRGAIYVFQDLHQAGLGWCNRSDISLTVAATVVSHEPRANRLFIDAGGLALSKDRSTSGTEFDARYGWIVDAVSAEPIGDLWVEQVYQEHGLVTSASGAALPFHRLPVGTVIAVQVNHADMTAAAYDGYHLTRDGVIVDWMERVNGW